MEVPTLQRIIPIFVPHAGCPHKCIFCDQRAISGVLHVPSGAEVADLLRDALPRAGSPAAAEVAFYGGSFTALPERLQADLLAAVQPFLQNGAVSGIRISTRPDAIDEYKLRFLLHHGVKTIELGVQSFDDRVLTLAERGHDSRAAREAIWLIKEKKSLSLGVQLMLGLPGQDWRSLITTIREAAGLRPHFLRIYPAVVLRGTALEELYNKGLYRPLTIKQAVGAAAFYKLMAERAGVKVIRTGLQEAEILSSRIVAGPYHPAFGEIVEAFIYYIAVAKILEARGREEKTPAHLWIWHHPLEHSRVRGIKKANTGSWRSVYGLSSINFVSDETQAKGSLKVEAKFGGYAAFNGNIICSINREMLSCI